MDTIIVIICMDTWGLLGFHAAMNNQLKISVIIWKDAGDIFHNGCGASFICLGEDKDKTHLSLTKVGSLFIF